MSAGVRNTAIKRIQGDVREMMTNPSDQYSAAPLETNMFDWHFTLRGPRDTEFEGGIYHGRILLPADYPFKPPNIMLLTPNGRFEVRKKICLSISAHHPEEWQPAWGVRLILEALISFMPTKGEGAIGALDLPAEVRRRLAKESVDFKCDICGKIADLLPEVDENAEGEEKKPSKYADQIAQLHIHTLEASRSSEPTQESEKTKDANEGSTSDAQAKSDAMQDGVARDDISKKVNPQGTPASMESHPVVAETAPQLADGSLPPTITEVETTPVFTTNAPTLSRRTQESDHIDTFLHYLTIALVVALFALVYRKMLQLHGVLQ